MREPTGDECNANAVLYEDADGVRGVACWYPQMGGYVGKAIIEVGRGDGCFEVYVWHDGEFPFSDESAPGESPAHLHHCMAEQFIRLGELVLRLQSGSLAQGEETRKEPAP